MKASLIAATLTVAILAPASIPAHAASSGWLTVTEVRGFMTRLSKRKLLPTNLKCKDNPGSNVSPLIKVKYTRNRSKTAWYWAWGTSYAKRNGPLLRAGYKRVSYSEFPSFFRGSAKCGLWHKKS